MPTPPVQQARRSGHHQNAQKPKAKMGGRKPQLVVDGGGEDPSQWLGFSLPARSQPSALSGPPRRSKRGEAWRGNAMTREKFVNANFRFILKPNEALSYGAHFADPDISLHWPNILQVLVPTFSAYSVAQGFVSSEAEEENDFGGEQAAERRRRIEEEKQGRSCPICLSKPVAGRITKCGHIFCFPCVLHFIELSEIPRAAACPICGDTIHEGMLKSVQYLDAETMVAAANGDEQVSGPQPEITRMMSEAKSIDSNPVRAHGGHRLHMRLLQRPQMTTLALPASATWPSDAIPSLSVPWYFLPDVLTYSRFALATPEYMLLQLQRELVELKAEWDLLAGDELGRGFVRAAREKVERQIGKVNEELMTTTVRRNEVHAREAWSEAAGDDIRRQERQRERERRAQERAEKEQRDEADLNVPVEFLAASSMTYSGPTVRVPPNLVVEPNPMPIGVDDTTKHKRRKSRSAVPALPPAPPAPAQFFYQSSLGANVFLNPLDARMLANHFGDNLPPHISFETTGYDSATVTDELRKRVKYLAHLPVGTEVVFVEADLKDIVSKEVLAQFEQPLRARRDKRRARTRREDRDKKRWEEAEKLKLPEIHVVPSAYAVPDMDADLAAALESSRLDAASASAFPTMGTSPPARSSALASSPVPAPSSSFASALRAAAVSRPAREVKVEGVDEAWDAFRHDDVDHAEESSGRKKKGGKKGKKLVFGGGGRQA